MRLCLFTPTFLPRVGGTEVVIDALARQFAARGHRTVVMAKSDTPRQPAALDVPYRVRWYRKPVCHRLFPERLGRQLRQVFLEEQFDLVLAFYGQPTGYTAVRFGQLTGVPVVMVCQGGDLYKASKHRRRPHLWRRIVYAYNHADSIVAISPYTSTLIREIVPQPQALESIPNGIDVDSFHHPAARPADFRDPRPFCLCLGNLGPMKGFDDAIRAFARVRKQVAPMAMVVVGSGRLERYLRDLVRLHRLDRDILFLGRRTGDDKRWLLQNCRFGLMPSIEEGHPIVGLELLSVGKPVICTTNPAFDDMYDELNAIRVPPRSPEALAEAMIQIGAMDHAWMGKISRDRAQRYAWSKIADRYLAMFDRLLTSRLEPRPVVVPVGAELSG